MNKIREIPETRRRIKCIRRSIVSRPFGGANSFSHCRPCLFAAENGLESATGSVVSKVCGVLKFCLF